jgi:hypothetical protein
MTDRELMKQALDALLALRYRSLKDEPDGVITALRDRLAHCDRCGKRLGGEGDIHTCTPLEQKRFEQWWDAGDDIPNDGPYTPDTPIQFAWAGWQAALAQPEREPVGDEWTPCMKLPVVVHVRKQRPGEAHVSTREGITPVKPDDLIMRGVSGEEYPIGRAIFEQTYTMDTTPPAAPMTEFEEAVAAVDNTLHHAINHWQDKASEQAAMLRECRFAIDTLIEKKPALAMLLCGSTTLGNLKASLHDYRVKKIFDVALPAAAQRTWVGLTDAEIDAEADKEEQAYGFIQGVAWAEAKLKEKNT